MLSAGCLGYASVSRIDATTRPSDPRSGPFARYAFRTEVRDTTPTGRVSQVPVTSFATRRPSQPRKAGPLRQSTLRGPRRLHPIWRVGRFQDLGNEANGFACATDHRFAFRGSGVRIAAPAARSATCVVDRSHGQLLSSDERSQACTDAPDFAGLTVVNQPSVVNHISRSLYLRCAYDFHTGG